MEFRRNCYLHGVTASAIYNVNRSDEKQYVFTPFDFSVSRTAEEEQRDEIIKTLKQSSLQVRMDAPDRIPQLKQDFMDRLTTQGIKDPEQIIEEVFGE